MGTEVTAVGNGSSVRLEPIGRGGTDWKNEKRKQKKKKKEEKKKKKETKQCLYAFSHRPVLLEPSEVFSLKFPKNVSLRETPSMGKCRPSSAPASAGGGQPERGRVGSLRVKEGGGMTVSRRGRRC